jgi:hypothetical protein
MVRAAAGVFHWANTGNANNVLRMFLLAVRQWHVSILVFGLKLKVVYVTYVHFGTEGPAAAY